jgi:hypothetical protein
MSYDGHRQSFWLLTNFAISFNLILTFSAKAEENTAGEYLCSPIMTSDVQRSNDASSSLCDFINDRYLFSDLSKSSLHKSSCEYDREILLTKLELTNESMIHYNIFFKTTDTFQRHDHSDGISGVIISPGQYQRMITFVPQTGILMRYSVGPFSGARVVLSQCVKT